MKKMTILAVILTLAFALTACGSEKAPETTAAATVAAATVTAETAAPQPDLTLADWSMDASTWSSPNGATIHIAATPNYYAEGQKAEFVVRLESDDVATVPCEWDGTSYTASADLNAANGYCYYMVLTAADGTSTEVAVNTPAAPVNETFIDIEAALEAYCSVTIEESVFEGSQLTLTTGTVQVKAPVITNEGETITCQEAVLVLSLNGQVLEEKALPLSQTGTEGLFEAAVDNILFEIPEVGEDQTVELALSAVLSNGQELSAYGGNWVSDEGSLLPVVG